MGRGGKLGEGFDTPLAYILSSIFPPLFFIVLYTFSLSQSLSLLYSTATLFPLALVILVIFSSEWCGIRILYRLCLLVFCHHSFSVSMILSLESLPSATSISSFLIRLCRPAFPSAFLFQIRAKAKYHHNPIWKERRIKRFISEMEKKIL